MTEVVPPALPEDTVEAGTRVAGPGDPSWVEFSKHDAPSGPLRALRRPLELLRSPEQGA